MNFNLWRFLHSLWIHLIVQSKSTFCSNYSPFLAIVQIHSATHLKESLSADLEGKSQNEQYPKIWILWRKIMFSCPRGFLQSHCFLPLQVVWRFHHKYFHVRLFPNHFPGQKQIKKTLQHYYYQSDLKVNPMMQMNAFSFFFLKTAQFASAIRLPPHYWHLSEKADLECYLAHWKKFCR